MKDYAWLQHSVFVLWIALTIGCECSESLTPAKPSNSEPHVSASLAGSKSCRQCHADFYKLWATSWHGLAMQPFTAEFAKTNLTPQAEPITIGKASYRIVLEANGGYFEESGPSGQKQFPILHVMGGKNIYYFLTQLERGRLQVLPLAYDVHQKAWYDVAASGVRHFPDRQDEALAWTDRLFAFNTSCFNCHVTELATNYDLASDTYHTTWTEAGITCESCHGTGREHVKAMESLAEGEKPHDLKIIRTKDFTSAQMNDMCATCHAKLIPLSLSFRPGDNFFDHYDLVTLENPDFYPDGRDLGENYTHTSWLQSDCVKSGNLDCNYCHTPSGRMRFSDDQSNQMCMPCHETIVKQPAEHGHHIAGSPGNDCIACHMPKTHFAAMGRTDHSMRPPMPAATLKFQSPNACNQCHTDQDAAWADTWVRKWYANDYQAEPLRRAEMIDMARKHDWSRLPEMLAELKHPKCDTVFKNSMVRLLAACDDTSVQPVLLEMLHDSSPLVRSSAATVLGERLKPEVVKALLAAVSDPLRLVRIRAAMALASVPLQSISDLQNRNALEKAEGEFTSAMQARPDDWASHANLGNYYMAAGNYPVAVTYFERAMQLEPRQIGPIVNAALAYNSLSQNAQAERCLRLALKTAPDNAAVNFNLGLLLAEQGHIQEAEQRLRAALDADPQLAAAAYNLGILLSSKDLAEAITWCQKAYDLRPADPKYARTLAFYLCQQAKRDEAIHLLQRYLEAAPASIEVLVLLGEIYEEQRDYPAAAEVYHTALKLPSIPSDVRVQLEKKLHSLSSGNR